MDFTIRAGDQVILSRPAVPGAGTRDIFEVVEVLPGPRTFYVSFTAAGTSIEASKNTRAQLKSSGVYILTIEIRGLGNRGLPKFNLKVED